MLNDKHSFVVRKSGESIETGNEWYWALGGLAMIILMVGAMFIKISGGWS